MQFTVKEILENSDCTLVSDNNSSAAFEISTDTRKIKKGDIYLPLRGENFDGHNFIDKALENGAIGHFTQDRKKIGKGADIVFYTKNCLITYLKLANYIRRKINPKVIAVTGSHGKTTVKEMLYSVISTEFKTHKSILNHNNEIGLCETMFQMPLDTEVLIVEMGMRNLGEIAMLSKYSEHDIGIITGVGSAHVEILGTRENIATAKCEIASNMPLNGLILAHNSDLIKKKLNFEGEKIFLSLKDVSNIEIRKKYSAFTYKDKHFELSIEGEHNIENALFVIEVANKLGIKYENIKAGLLNFKPIEKRWEISKIQNATFINDSYNANPESMVAALKTFLLTYKNDEKMLILGDMAELGKNSIKYHRQIGEFLENYQGIKLVTVGKFAKYISKNTNINCAHFDTNNECAKFLSNYLRNNITIFLKASRSMKFEDIIEMAGKI